MSVLINMDMPKNCHNCELSAKVNLEYGNGYFCQMLVEMIANTHERKANCPLAEVPEPHGRLIDADALDKMLKFIGEAEAQIYGRNSWGFVNKCRQALEDAPTVIPASEVDT